MGQKKFEAALWIVIKPAADVPGEWVSHCLNLDLLSQGTSVEHALDMMIEALLMVVADDLAAGRDPLARGKRTPKADWAEQSRIVQQGQRHRLSQIAKQPEATVAVNVKVKLELRESNQRVQRPRQEVEKVPPAWLISTATGQSHIHR